MAQALVANMASPFLIVRGNGDLLPGLVLGGLGSVLI
jgi:hypothetical protein